MPAQIQNYVTLVYAFGDWERNTVLPEFVVLWAYGPGPFTDEQRKAAIKEMVDRKMIAPTRDQVAKETLDKIRKITETRKVKAQPEPDTVPEAAQLEIQELKAQLQAERDAAAALELRATGAEGKAQALLNEIADYVQAHSELTGLSDRQAARIDDLEKQLTGEVGHRESIEIERSRLAGDLESLKLQAATKKPEKNGKAKAPDKPKEPASAPAG